MAIKELPDVFRQSLSSADVQILNLPISVLVSSVQKGERDPSDILVAFSKKSLEAHRATNCLTEIMILSAQTWAKECNRNGPLAGVPVSLKDTVGISGWDSTCGISAWVGKPSKTDSTIVKLLRDAGAVPFVKTNIPITLLSFESASDLFGVAKNPHNTAYTPGGSSGGEAALLAYGGARIGIGSDVAGSVRIPAHYSGVYTIKCSTGRMPKMGSATSIPGQEGVPAVYSPMARTLEDLETFWRAIVSMKPWEYEHTCLELPWRPVDLSNKTLRFGVMWDDGVVRPSPACARALKLVVDSVQRAGHTAVPITPPSPYEGLKLAFQLMCADAIKTATAPIRFWESNDPGMRQARLIFGIPHWMRKLYVWWIRYVKRDEIYAGLVEVCYEKSVMEYWPLVAKRETYKKEWFDDVWKGQDLDFVLTVPNSLPAVRHGGMKEGWKACGYTFLFNLLDLSSGVLPVTRVDAALDNLENFQARNAIEEGQYRLYDSVSMAGLPVGVQLVGKRLEEEKVMEGMKLIEQLLLRDGKIYELLAL
ncbi:amidase signature enzyme [Hymenopellis radicata]|nr:amidase signature enzyme [Hymenopellis radicata]